MLKGRSASDAQRPSVAGRRWRGMPERRPSIELDPIDLDNDGADTSNNNANSGIDDDASIVIDSLSPANGKLNIHTHPEIFSAKCISIIRRDIVSFLFDISH